MKRLEIISDGNIPPQFFTELDFLKHQQELDYYQLNNNTIQIYSENPDFVGAMSATIDWVKQQSWYVAITFQCITKEEFFQEKL